MTKFMLVALTLCVALCAYAQPTTKKVGVYITGEVNPNYKKVFAAKLVTQITQTDEYVAVERTNEFLAALSREHDYQISGAVSNNEIARLGAQLGVHYVLVVDLTELFEEIFVSVRALDVETAQIVASAEQSAKVDSMHSLTDLANNSAITFINAIKYAGIISKIKIFKFSAANFDLLRYGGYEIIDDVDIVKYVVATRDDVRLPIITNIEDLPYLLLRDNDSRFGGVGSATRRYRITYLAGSGYWSTTQDVEITEYGLPPRYDNEVFQRHPFDLCNVLCIVEE